MEVEIKDLTVHLDDRGYLFELLREDDEIVTEDFAQITLSEIYPESVKAWHRHQKQTDYIACVKGNLKIGLCSEEDGEWDVTTECIGEDNRCVVKVPPGIWHGMAPIGTEPALVVYVHDQTYDPDDEERRPHNSFGDVWDTDHR